VLKRISGATSLYAAGVPEKVIHWAFFTESNDKIRKDYY
jgi:hypothetical protein